MTENICPSSTSLSSENSSYSSVSQNGTSVSKSNCGRVITVDQKKSIIHAYESVRKESPKLTRTQVVHIISKYLGIGTKSIFRITREYELTGTQHDEKSKLNFFRTVVVISNYE